MSKFRRDEINEALQKEGGYKGLDIPYDAHSKFTFEINERVADLFDQISEIHKPKYAPEKRHIDAETGEVFFTGGRHKEMSDNSYEEDYDDNVIKTDIDTGTKHRKGDENGLDISSQPWDFREGWNDNEYYLWDPEISNCCATVVMEEDKMKISTAWSGFEYQISQNEKGGSTVEFSGPLNALMNQNLLPHMTYVNGTLKGKFVDDKGDITPYLPIEDYCLLRAQKNQGKENQQDVYGARINAKFNNEIPIFKKWVEITAQERKINNAQREFEEGGKIFDYVVENKVDLIRNRLAKNKELTSEIRDGMAKTKESGYKHISRTPSLNKGGRED